MAKQQDPERGSGGLLREIWVVIRAIFDRRVAWHIKAIVLVVAAYIALPLDLVPDVIPFAGWLDDTLAIPLGLWLIHWLVPDEVLADLRGDAVLETPSEPAS